MLALCNCFFIIPYCCVFYKNYNACTILDQHTDHGEHWLSVNVHDNPTSITQVQQQHNDFSIKYYKLFLSFPGCLTSPCIEYDTQAKLLAYSKILLDGVTISTL